MKELLLTIVLWLMAFAGRASERVFLDATINGKPSRLILDTGANAPALFPEGARRLGLKIKNAPPDFPLAQDGSAYRVAEECDLTVADHTTKMIFLILAPSANVSVDNIDGLIGWPLLNQSILEIDAAAQTAKILNEVPREAETWTKLKMQKDSDLLALCYSDVSALVVDTGDYHGIDLTPAIWQKWKAAHRDEPKTLEAYYTPIAGMVVKEEMWAEKFSFGPLKFTSVPVMEASTTNFPIGALQYGGTIGTAALKQLDLIVDGKKNVAYIRPKKAAFAPYEHNRLGAVFLPEGSNNDDLIARVADGTPAFEVGIRKGDLLLKVNGADATVWRTNRAILDLVQFWQRPSGTKFQLMLERGTNIFDKTVVLRNLLPPDSK